MGVGEEKDFFCPYPNISGKASAPRYQQYSSQAYIPTHLYWRPNLLSLGNKARNMPICK